MTILPENITAIKSLRTGEISIEICGENQTARRELNYESFYICIEAKKSGRIKKVS